MTARPESGGLDRRAVRRRLAVVAGALAVLAASRIYSPWSETGPVLCPLRLVTGFPCPSCGMTRSFCAAARGDLAASFGFHALGPILVAVTIAAVPVLLAEAWRGRRFDAVHRLSTSTRVAWAVGAAFAAFHVTRLVAQAASGGLSESVSASVIGSVWRHATR